jgi:hypothetical protein
MQGLTAVAARKRGTEKSTVDGVGHEHGVRTPIRAFD